MRVSVSPLKCHGCDTFITGDIKRGLKRGGLLKSRVESEGQQRRESRSGSLKISNCSVTQLLSALKLFNRMRHC